MTEKKWTVPPELAPYAQWVTWPIVGEAEQLMNRAVRLCDNPLDATAQVVVGAQYELLAELYEAGLLVTPRTRPADSGIREAIRRALAHADGVDFDQIDEHDYQRQADLLLAMLLTRMDVPSFGRTMRVFKVRNHNLDIEEDFLDAVTFEGLSDEQAGMLDRAVGDSVWYDTQEIKEEKP